MATGRARQRGGLFRDYRPKGWDEEGADIRGGTPGRWVDIEGGDIAEEDVVRGGSGGEGDDGGGAGVGGADAWRERSSEHLGRRDGAFLDDEDSAEVEEGEQIEMEDAE